VSKLNISNKVTYSYYKGRMVEIMREIETLVNALSEEKISSKYKATTAAPTTGGWAEGDFVRHSSPAEAGGAGSKYVIVGWICTVSGTPGTWNECRVLTGN